MAPGLLADPDRFPRHTGVRSAAIWLWVRFSLAPAVAVIESRGPIAAMSRSAHLVRGAWWRIFGISLLAFAMAALAGLVFQQFVEALGVFPGLFDTADDNSDLTADRPTSPSWPIWPCPWSASWSARSS